jgi:branched-subunit amino acid aminotransferase/4-amino-4-deoxychorismate lyase
MAELDGRPVTPDELQVLALTNYGSFTSLRVDDGRVRGLPFHLDRLVRDARVLFGAEPDRDHVRGLIRRAAPASGSATIRVTVFDPATDLGHPGRAGDPQILVTQRSAGPLPLPALTVRSAVHRRDLPEVKSVGLFGSLRHRRAAQLDGYDDALFVDAQGVISEGVTWNIGFLDGDHVVWPDAEVLPGVTMQLLQQVHAYRSARIGLSDVGSMQAAFATNAAIGVRAIARIDDVELPTDHPFLDVLRKEYTNVPGDTI